jgi:hypothetical protein
MNIEKSESYTFEVQTVEFQEKYNEDGDLIGWEEKPVLQNIILSAPQLLKLVQKDQKMKVTQGRSYRRRKVEATKAKNANRKSFQTTAKVGRPRKEQHNRT